MPRIPSRRGTRRMTGLLKCVPSSDVKSPIAFSFCPPPNPGPLESLTHGTLTVEFMYRRPLYFPPVKSTTRYSRSHPYAGGVFAGGAHVFPPSRERNTPHLASVARDAEPSAPWAPAASAATVESRRSGETVHVFPASNETYAIDLVPTVSCHAMCDAAMMRSECFGSVAITGSECASSERAAL